MTKLTKDQIAKELVKYDITLSPSQVKKTPIAELEQMLVDAINAEAGKHAGGKVIPMKPRASKGINLAPKPAAQIKACRAGTVQAALVDLLVDGATLWELQGAAAKWSESSVKSGLHYDVHFVKGYGVRTEVLTPRAAYDAGHEAHCENMLGTELEHEPVVAVYFLVLPAGMTEPLAHVEPARAKVAANKK